MDHLQPSGRISSARRPTSLRAKRCRLLGTLLAATLILGTAIAQPTPARITVVTADPASADEGARVDFNATLDPGDEGSLLHTWDFGDGVTATGIDLLAIRHRFADDGSYTVVHGIERPDGSDRRTATTTVTVANVAPQVQRLDTSHGPLPGLPVTLSAAAVDPGDDVLTYTWDFGDGTAPTQPSESRHAVHTFEEAGTYVVYVTVEDGDGGTDTLGLEVTVADGFAYELSGDATARPRDGATPTLTGFPVERGPDGLLRFRGDLAGVVAGEEDVADGPGSCLVIISSQSAASFGHMSEGTSLTFTAALENGLAVGRYPIAVERNVDAVEWRDPYEVQLADPGTFYASLSDEVGATIDSGGATFHGAGGTLTIHRFDGRRLEASFQLDLEESLGTDVLRSANPRPARTAHAFGAIHHDVSTSMVGSVDGLNAMLGATFGDAYLCGSSEPVAVVSHDVGHGPEHAGAATAASPSAAALLPAPTTTTGETRVGLPWRWEPYSDGDAKLEFTFDRPMDPDTLNDRTIWLDIPAGVGPGAPFEPITGIVEAVDDHTFRFLPDWDMRSGVTYHMTIRGGADGVRGTRGEILEQDYAWGFQTAVELESVVVTATQVSRGATLVPNKPTLVRVYAFWSGHDDLPPELQAYEIGVTVAVEVDGVAVFPPRDVVMMRPDQYGAEARRNARHTVNFFGWKPTQFGGTSTLTATVEHFLPTSAAVPPVESRPVTLRHWDRSPTLTIEYFYLEVGSWAGGVPEATLNDHPRHVERSADFAAQNLPVVGVDTWWRGPLALDEPEMEFAATDDVWRTTCIVPNASFVFTDGLIFPELYAGGHPYDWRLGWELHRATPGSQADVVVGIVPQDVASACGWLGAMTALHGAFSADVRGPRYVLLSENSRVPTLAHELGHFFGLCHEDNTAVGCVHRFGASIEGFRIDLDGRAGRNKSETEGNGEAPAGGDLIPLMRRLPTSASSGATLQFVTDQHYRRLFTTMAQRGIAHAPFGGPILVSTRANDAWTQGTAGVDAHVSVWALVAPDGRNVLIDRLRPTPGRAAGEAFGAYHVSLVDEDGSELASVRVGAYAGESVHLAPPPGAATEVPLADPFDEPIRVLDAVLPYDERAHAVVVTLDGQEVGRITRSANPPSLDARLDGTTVHWNTEDADGDMVIVDVAYAPDGHAWVPLAVGRPSAGHLALHAGMEPGSEPILRVRASDGFDTVERLMPLEASPPLRVVARSHVDGTTLDPQESMWLTFNTRFATGHDPGTLATLAGPDGRPIEIDAHLLPGERRLLLTPRAPLEPGAYRVDVGAAYRAFGTHPPEGSAWQVVVEAAAEPAPAQPASIPDTCAGVDRAIVEALLPQGHELVSADADAGCTVRVRHTAAPDRVRAALEVTLLRERYLPTRNVQDAAGVTIDFEGAGRSGQFRLEPDGTGTSVTMRIEVR